MLRRVRQALLPFPGQALGLLLLVAVLAAVGVSAPLMVASSGQGVWEQREARGLEALGLSLVSGTGSPQGGSPVERLGLVPELDEAVRASGRQVGLEEPVLTTLLAGEAVAQGPDGTSPVQLVSRPGYAEAVELVEGEVTDPGVLVPAAFAERTGAGPGDTVSVVAPGDELLGTATSPAVEVEVTGVYADITAPAPEFWQGIGDLVVPRENPATGAVVVPPPVLLASLDTALEVEQGTASDVFLLWFFPTPAGLLVPQARELSGAGESLQARLVAPGQPVADLIDDAGFTAPQARTALPVVLEDVDATVGLLSPPVRAVGVGGVLAALALVGAWAGARARRREGELRALIARGLSPARGGAEAALEAVLPVLGGVVAGGLAGWGAVAALGPAARLPGQVVPSAAGVLVAVGVVAVAVVAVVTAAAVARLGRVGQGPAAQLAGRIPWLPVLAAVTVVVAAPLVTGGGRAPAGGVSVLVLVVPLLAVLVVAGAVVALLQRLAPRVAGRVRRLPPAGFLALRRVMTGPGATRLVVVTTALALGLVTYAGALADSTARTIAVKASVATGSDVVVDLPRGREIPQDLEAATGGRLTAATVVGLDNRVSVLPDAGEADVLVVDPTELPRVVRWNEALSDQPLGELMAALQDGLDGSGGRVPVIAAGALPVGPVQAVDGKVTLDLGGYQLPAQVVARTSAFPGQSSLRPLLVAPWGAYSAAVAAAERDPDAVITRQVWSRGQAPEVLAALSAAGIGPDRRDTGVRTAAEFSQRPELAAQTWSLGYLRAVALAAGLLGLLGLVLHAAAQARQRTVAGLLLARMGLSGRATATSAALETGLLAAVAALVAVAVTLPAAALVLGLLDPVPDLPPDPLVALPWGTVAGVAAGVLAVAATAGVLAARTAATAHPGQVMRDAD